MGPRTQIRLGVGTHEPAPSPRREGERRALNLRHRSLAGQACAPPSPSPRSFVLALLSFVLALLRALHLWLRLRFGAARPPRGKVHSTQAVTNPH